MPRIVSIWLPRWPIQRFLTDERRKPAQSAKIDPARPFVLSVDAAGGPRIAAANEAASALGLLIEDGLADARAKAGVLQIRPVDPEADDAALRRLTLWATRYTPSAAPFDVASGADGLFLDITGSAHLFGGEAALLADLAQRLAHVGLEARLAIADTPGAAWALSRYHALPSLALPSGEERTALASLPIAALRLRAATRQALRRLGFKRVGSLAGTPRAALAARFETELLRRLDQAFGLAVEPLAFLAPPPAYHVVRHLLEPILHREAVVRVALHLMQDLVRALERDGVGARTLRLCLYRVDGAATTVELGLAMPTRSPEHVARLVALKLERVEAMVDVGFGFETLVLAVDVAEPMPVRQTELATGVDAMAETECFAALLDRLKQRLGARRVRQIAPVESHVPERAEIVAVATGERPAWPKRSGARPRPILLLERPEPAEVLALIPDGPPRRFRWRGMTHGVALAEGPERIATEWWRARGPEPTRDYYLVEDEVGRRFWLYREGLQGRETAAPRWFVHGLFA